MSNAQYVLTLSCQNRPGIVAAVSSYLFNQGADIREAQQFDDTETGKFFARIAFDLRGDAGMAPVREGFAELAEPFKMNYAFSDHTAPRRVLLLVSKFDHCLADLLYRWRIGELQMTGHGDRLQPSASRPMPASGFRRACPSITCRSPGTPRWSRRRRSGSWCEQSRSELVVLARYMQVLSDGLTRQTRRSLHQYPSLVPARLQGRQALPPGACARA